MLYRVEYRLSRDGTGPWVAAPPTGDTSYVLVGLDVDQPYQARVTARSLFAPDPPGAPDAWSGAADGDAAASNLVAATPVAPLAVPPTALRVAWVEDTQVALEWTPAPRAEWYTVEFALADEAYGAFDPWRAYGAPPAAIADPRLVVPALLTGRLYRFRVRAHNRHVATAAYPGFTGPTPPVLARPIPPPARPARLALLPPRVLHAGAAAAGGAASVGLGPSASNATGAYVGAYLRVLAAAGDLAPRRVVAYAGETRTAAVDPPFPAPPPAGARVEIEQHPLLAGGGGGGDGAYSAAVGFPNQPDASRFRLRVRSAPDTAGLPHAAWAVAAAIDAGAAGAALPAPALGGCAGLGGAPLGAPGFVDAVTRPWELPAPAPGAAGAEAVPDLCLEAAGLRAGWAHELVVEAGNENVDWSPPSDPVRIVPRSPPAAAPRGPLLVLAQGPASIALYWPPLPGAAAALAAAAEAGVASGEFYRVDARVLGTDVWETVAALPPLAVEHSGTVVAVRAGGSVLQLDPARVPVADGALVGLCLSVAAPGGVTGLPGGAGTGGAWVARQIAAYWANGTALLDAGISPPPVVGAAFAVSRAYIVAGLRRGAGHEFAVYAANAAGPAAVAPLRGLVPAPARGVRVARLAVAVAELAWERPAQATHFRVEAAVGPGGAFLMVVEGVAGTTAALTAAQVALPAAGAGVALRVRACGAAVGPCEAIGADATALMAAGAAGGVVDAWISSKTRSSFVVQVCLS